GFGVEDNVMVRSLLTAGLMSDSTGVPVGCTKARDPHTHRINLLGDGAPNTMKARLLGALGRSRLGWRFNFTVRGAYKGRTLKIPLVLGRGFQNVHIGEPWLFKAFEKVLAAREGAFLDVGVNLGQTLIKVKLIDPARRYVG